MWCVYQVLYTGDFSRQEDRHLMAAEIPSVHPDVLITVSQLIYTNLFVQWTLFKSFFKDGWIVILTLLVSIGYSKPVWRIIRHNKKACDVPLDTGAAQIPVLTL